MNNKVEYYIEKGFPEQWFDYANELKEAAQTLWKSDSNTYIGYLKGNDFYQKKLFSRTYFFLLGIAIENLLKGILISENPNHIKDGKISPEISSGHNLKKLSEKINSLDFNTDEIRLFEILSEVIPYWGKYPIPKDFNQIKEEKFFNENLFIELINLYEKLELKIYNLNKDGIQGPNGVRFPKLILTHLEKDK